MKHRYVAFELSSVSRELLRIVRRLPFEHRFERRRKQFRFGVITIREHQWQHQNKKLRRTLVDPNHSVVVDLRQIAVSMFGLRDRNLTSTRRIFGKRGFECALEIEVLDRKSVV